MLSKKRIEEIGYEIIGIVRQQYKAYDDIYPIISGYVDNADDAKAILDFIKKDTIEDAYWQLEVGDYD